MLLRKLSNCFLPILILFAVQINGQDCPDDGREESIIQFNLNSCTATTNGSYSDYRELTGLSANKSDCATITVIGHGSALYRNNPSVNIHSCTPGIDGTAGMCVDSETGCSFVRGSDKAIRFDVEVVPGVDLAQLKTLTFYEKAPINYDWIGGDTGKNNYPTKYGIRITSDGREVFSIKDLPTGRDWSLQTIDLSFFSGLVVDKATIFSFELTAYCIVDNGRNLSLWDVDHIRLYGGCIDDINGGMVALEDGSFNTTTCSGDGLRDAIDPTLKFSKGDLRRWLITDESGNILDLPSNPPFDFESAGEGVCLIWNISYTGDLGGVAIGANASDITGCYDLSNPITINRNGVSNSTIFIDNGNEEVSQITLCTNDGKDDLVSVGSRSNSMASDRQNWVITDQSGTIIESDARPPFNFEGVDEGTCLIWQVNYRDGLLGNIRGENIADLSGCYTVSNSLTVIRNQPLAGTIEFNSTPNDELEICAGDGLSDELRFRLDGEEGDESYWVITSNRGRIISVSDSPDYDFEQGDLVTYFVRHLSSYEELQGLEVDNDIDDVEGCFTLSNTLTVTRNRVGAGSITTSNGLTETGICVESGSSNLIDVDLEVDRDISANSAWLITSTGGRILDLPSGPPFDFSDAEGGAQLIWHLSYEAISGLEIGQNANDLSGCFDLSDPIRVNVGKSVGGTITGGPYLFCVGDGDANFIPRDDISLGGASGSNSQWVITDDRGEILGLPSRPSDVNFDDAPEGVCLVWHLSYEDGLEGLEIGNDALRDLEGCYGLSNSIEVTRTSVVGGDLEGGPFSFCVGDGIIDTIVRDDLNLFRWRGTNRIWFVTDTEGNILSTPVRPSLVNFDDAPAGTCLIWHGSYEGEISGTDIGDNINDITGCFDLSNPATVNRGGAGESTLEGGPFTFCVGDGEADRISSNDISNNTASGPGAQWIITDRDGDIVGLPSRATDVDFDEVAEGTCLIYFLNYSGDIDGLEEGENVSRLDGCYSLSNSITVNRLSAIGGELEGGPFSFCVGDGVEDRISDDDINLFSSEGDNRRWLVTDDAGVILEIPASPSDINFDEAPAGVCLLWHLSYSGELSGLDTGSNANDLNGCFDLSNAITIVRGGSTDIVLEGGPFDFCVSDGEPDMIAAGDISSNAVSGEGAQWIITDENGDILGLPERPTDVNFDDVAEGTCLIYFVSFAGDIIGLSEGQNVSDLDGCFSLSNSITVNRSSASGGMLEGGPFNFCIGDGTIDTIVREDLNLFGWEGENRIWFVTDTEGNILATPVRPSLVNFDEAEAGTCLIWHGSYEGEIEGAEVGSNINDISGCFDISNSVTVNRGGAGAIELEGGPFSFCVGNGEADMIAVSDLSVTVSSGPGTQWVITDEGGNIVGLPAQPSEVNFDDVAEGTCLIYIVSFAGDITGLTLDSNINTDLEGCYSLSNSVTVDRSVASGGELTGGPFNFCIGDGIDDFVSDDDLTLTGSAGDSRRWIITDASGTILGLPVRPSLVNFEDAGSGTCLIWHLSFSGDIEGLEVGANALDLDGCFSLSNPISVFRIDPKGGMLTGGPFEFCTGDGVADNIPSGGIVLGDSEGSNRQWIVTDENGEILGLPDDPSEVNFDEAGEGVCLIWHLSYEGDISNLEVGNNASDLQGCFDLSNSISVTRNEVAGGSISGGPFTFCVGDSIADNIPNGEILLVDNSGTNGQWLVTDTLGNILGLPVDPSDVNFDDAGSGVCLVWHLSYEDGLTGLEVGMNASNLTGCFALTNSIRVDRDQPMGGTIIGGPFEFCVGDTIADNVQISLTGNSGANSQWVVTDDQGNILDLPADIAEVDFNDAEAGVCLIWHLSFEDGLEGAMVGNNASDLEGCFSLSNSIAVTRKSGTDCLPPCEVDGGQLSGGPFMFCVGDEIRDTIPAGSVTLDSAVGLNLQWVVTDIDGNILGLPADISDVDFDVAGVGECLIWNLTFEDGLTGAAVGNNANQLGGCFELSNPISVIRARPQGGILSPSSFAFCVGDGVADTIATEEITIQDAEGTNSQWVVTDIAGSILSLPANISDVNFDDAPAGQCLVWHLSFEDGLTGAAVGSNANDLNGCFSLSNPITINRNEPVGGTITGGPFEFCVGDSIADNIPMGAITLAGNTGDSSQWIITDTLGNILGLAGMPSEVNFEDAPTGVCLVWHLSYTGEVTGLIVGQNASGLSGCLALSNSITVTRKSGEDCQDPCDISAGTIAGGPFTFCVGDSIADNIAVGGVTLTVDSLANTQWVVTDEQGNILGLPSDPSDVNFDDAGAGTCLIWNITYQDSTTVFATGVNANNLGGCYALSNSIAVTRNQPIGGTLTGGPFTFCVGDSIADNIAVDAITLTGNSGNSQWVVTDTIGTILGLPASPSDVDFDDAGVGTCLVWHLSFFNSLTGSGIGLNANDIVGCYDLSNPITVNRSQPIGGTITGGPFEFCVGDSIADNIPMGAITLSGQQGSNSQWVVTDDLGNIIGLPSDPSAVDFESAEEGICFLWHLSFEDGLVGAVIDSNANNLSGCFSLSNSIQVVRNSGEDCAPLCEAVAGTLRGGPFAFCVGDSISDNIPSGSITLIVGDTISSTKWVVTDEQGIILGLPNAPTDVNFDNAGIGTCLVWNVSYQDSTTVFAVGANANALGGCYALSNSIAVVRSQPIGGTLEGGPFAFCVGDSIPDNIPIDGINLVGNKGANSQWVVTDTTGMILGLPTSPFGVDFDDAGAGTCLVWHLSFEDGLQGAAVGMNANNLAGCFSLSNPITVERTQPIGGVLTGGPFTFCVGDGLSDFIPIDSITLSGNSISSNSQWVITDTLGIILELPANYEVVNFEDAPAGACLVWHLSFEGPLSGGAIGMSADSLSGCFDLSNPIRINRVSGLDCPIEECNVDGGVIVGGPFEFCVGDGLEDTIAIDAITLDSAVGETFQWVVTDDSGIILGLPEDPSSVNFDIAPAGTCVIQHMSIMGQVESLAIGNNLITQVSGCFDLSNSIIVTRNTGEDCPTCDALGGRLISTVFTFCVGDAEDDFVQTGQIVLTENAGANTQWVVADTAGEILGLPTEITNVDFGIVDPGTYLIRVVSFDGALQNLAVGNNLALLSGCFGISEPSTVNVIDPQGGTLVGGPYTFCVGDGIADTIDETLVVNGATGENNRWVITDQDQNIIGLPTNIADVDFDQAGVDTCLIWNVSFRGTIDGLIQDSLALSDISGCYGVSNPVAVNRVGGDDCLSVVGVPVINEITDNDRVEIKNIGSTPIDVGTYWLCNRPLYERINSLTIECGGDDYIIAPGEVLTLVLDIISVAGQDGELGLYKSSLFANSSAIVDYVQWGSSDHGRASVAIDAGIWTAMDSVPSFNLGRSISYDGDGDSSSDWTETDPNLCEENAFVTDPQEKLSIMIFPVPASSEINFELNHDINEMHKVSIYDNFGHTLYSTDINAEDDFKLNVSDFKAGIYYLKVKTGRYSGIQRFVIVN